MGVEGTIQQPKKPGPQGIDLRAGVKTEEHSNSLGIVLSKVKVDKISRERPDYAEDARIARGQLAVLDYWQLKKIASLKAAGYEVDGLRA